MARPELPRRGTDGEGRPRNVSWLIRAIDRHNKAVNVSRDHSEALNVCTRSSIRGDVSALEEGKRGVLGWSKRGCEIRVGVLLTSFAIPRAAISWDRQDSATGPASSKIVLRPSTRSSSASLHPSEMAEASSRVELSLSGRGVTIGSGALAYLHDAACKGCERDGGTREKTEGGGGETKRTDAKRYTASRYLLVGREKAHDP